METAPDWLQIGEVFQTSHKSTREIAKDFGVSHTAIHKQAKKRKWVRPEPEPDWSEPCRVKVEREPSISPAEPAVVEAEPSDLVKRGRGIILALMAELEMENANIHLLAELVEIETAKDRAPHRRRALEKALSLPVRTQAAKNLATALATLRDAAPGKKEQAKADAEAAATDSRWASILSRAN